MSLKDDLRGFRPNLFATFVSGLASIPAVLAAPTFLRGHPALQACAPFLAMALMYVLLAVFGPVHGFFQRVVSRLRVGEWSGISRIYPVQGFPQHGDAARQPDAFALAKESLRQAVRAEGEIKLLLVSGFKHLGAGRHPGWIERELVDRRKPAKVEILLLDPTSDAAKARAAHDKIDHAKYTAGIEGVLWKIRGWSREQKMLVEVRLYTEEPIWQMVLTPSEVWLLCAHRVAVENSPVYCLNRKTPYGLAYGMEAVWERRWGLGKTVNLELVQEPKDFGAIISNASDSVH